MKSISKKHSKKSRLDGLKKVFAIMMTVLILLPQNASACSFFFFNTPQGNRIVGRTMEGPIRMDENIFIAPRNHNDFNGVTGPYGYVGIRHGETEWVSTGINEHGLNVESLGLGANGGITNYLPAGEGDYNQQNLLPFILANAKTVDEAIALVKKTKVETSELEVAHNIEVGLHFSITDLNKAIVIEYVDGSGYPVIYENKLGVMTNEPEYPVQEALASDVIGGESYDVAHAKYSDTEFRPFSRTSTGRFQHLVSLNYVADYTRVQNDFQAVNYAWSMLNTLDIPQGVLYWKWLDENPQMVGYSNVVDLKNKIYYVRSYDNQSIQQIDLKKIDFAKTEYKEVSIFDQANQYNEVAL
ncbi:linear amide C-N hydrolase [Algibacter mikhailovii]|uniref:Choloylglycine hydrolase n=1 Tax=Algibacter mikhailovii TaxID=425498 RepID=A0A918QWQ5_9FLAO|nr:linear amide C-N hydrolase [Algibacter mikhailovii]GGZ71879.1 choloylglycine hydrolase [Algibacter mikhailovii]